MWFVLSIIGLMLAADAWWWWYADRAARKAELSKRWRVAIGIFMSLTLIGLVLLLAARIIRMEAMIMPEWAVKMVFIWHFLLLPLVFLPSLAGRIASAVRRVILPPRIEPLPEQAPISSRRAFLAQAMIIAPPVVTLAMTGQAAIDRDDFRVRKIDLPIPNLPPALDGLTIAHVADPHIGSFMSDAKFKAIIQRTNDLDADLVLHAGDLINHSLKDLPDGIEMLRAFRGRYGAYSCQGNHDLIDKPFIFERDTRRADVGMLLDAAPTLRIKGQNVQIMAPRWGGRTDDGLNKSVNRLLPLRDNNAFTILLAHHPHCFDAAANAGIPLTLCGHTHGGQIRLFGDLGFGPLMYRYWSGAYRRNDSTIVVSNGIGNWFPLRLNVPCEIIHLTLRHA